MADSTQTTRFRFWLWLIRVIGEIVPRRLRADWRQEWEAELRYRERLLAEWDRLDSRHKLDLLRRSTSAFWDALWLQPQRWEDEMFQDLRYGLRVLRRSPGFSVVAVLTLALGIGVNTAIFTLSYAMVWRPLPVKDTESLVRVERTRPDGSHGECCLSYPDYVYYRDHNQVFSNLIAYTGVAPLTMSGADAAGGPLGGGAEILHVALVSGNYFAALGGGAMLGHTFTPHEDRTPGAHPVLVLSYHFWQRRFGGDPAVVGKNLKIHRQQFTIIGVAARDFAGIWPQVPDVWVPLMMQDRILHFLDFQSRNSTFLRVMGRLKPGLTLTQAQAEMAVLASQLAQAYPASNEKIGVTLVRALSYTEFEGMLRTLFLLVTVAAVMVLLIACANVANLLLARAATRQKEIAVRLAVGASRLRLVRQLLTESILIAVLGGVAGLLLANCVLSVLLKVVLSSLPPEIGVVTVALNLRPDLSIFSFTVLASLLTGVTFGLVPALEASRTDLTSALKQTSSSSNWRSGRLALGLSFRDLLTVAQMAVCVVLLVGAALLIRGVQKAQAIDPGYETKRMLVVEPNFLNLGYDTAKTTELHRQLMERIAALPGVKSVSLSTRTAGARKTTAVVLGEGEPSEENRLTALYTLISPNYFQTMSIPLARGRSFTEQEMQGAMPGVVIVSETTAQRLWPGADPIGKRLKIGAPPQGSGKGFEPEPYSPSCEVVGVARDVRSFRLSEVDAALLYLPLLPTNQTQVWLLARTGGQPQNLIAAIRNELQAVDRNVFPNVTPLEATLAQQMLPTRILSIVCSALGLLGLALAAVGLYGVIAYAVSQRTHEIGVRMALGAERHDVLKLILGQGLRVVVLGAACGLAGAAAMTRFLSALLYGLSPLDSIAFVGVTLFLVAVAMMATYLPAHRATKVDPVVALRYE
jgi:putative ABC transport system permease protein